MLGIPLRIEIGPKDIEKGKCILVRRDNREKTEADISEVVEKVREILETEQQALFDKAKSYLDTHIQEAHTYSEFKDCIENKPGFVKAMWCGDVSCEEKIKADTTATSRCMPFDGKPIDDKCVCCGKPAHKLVYWGKAY